MTRQTRLLGLLFAVWMVAAVATAQSYTVRFAPGTERINRALAGTGKNLDELTDLLITYRPRLEQGTLAVRLTALQNVVDRFDEDARAQALQQAMALKRYLVSTCLLDETVVMFDIEVDARTDLYDRVIAEVVRVSSPAGTARTSQRTPSAPKRIPSKDWKKRPATAKTSSRPIYRDGGLGFGVKTNVLMFAGIAANGPMYTPAPNLAAEVYFASRFSAQLSVAYAMPYNKGNKNNLFELMAFSLEPRFWLFGDGSYRGFYGGVYAQYGTFDVRIKEELEDNCMGSYMGGGLSVGWLQPLWRELYIDAGARVGYRSDAVDVYEFSSKGNKRIASYTLNSFTLQGINLSIGYRF